MKKYFFLFLSIIAFNSGFSQDISENTFNDLSFRSIGPATMSGRIVDIDVLRSNPYTFYLASATGGVWLTENNGVTYRPIFENEATHSVGDIALNQKYPHILWVGTGERANRQSSSWGDGVYKSHDGGKTWTNTGLKDSHHIGRIVLHPDDSNKVYVAAMGHLWGPNNERGLYVSTNGGETWERKLYIDDDTGVVDIAMDPSDPNIMYATTYQRRRKAFGFHGDGPGSGLYKSTDGGETWTELTKDLPEGNKGRIGIAIYEKDPNIVYVCVEQGFQYNASTAYTRRRAGIYRSEDKGASWTFMSDWNPRPMYASQITIDPNDDQRIYMVNSFSYSDDGGKTFTNARQSLHGDDRFVWVNPNNSNHVMKADDGGLGISYDRAKTWLYVTNLPISQFYRVGVDMQTPYRVYGGLQDNGSWMGPSETYRSEGILNSDWIKTGGGDGFLNLVSRENDDLLFTESQYLGLSLLNTKTRQGRSIRPGDPKGRIGARRNWDAWGPGVPEPELGNAMAPANWDGPFHLSVHTPSTIYAGTNKLWKSTDNGTNWTDLGDLTTGVNRRELKIMGQRPDSLTASLDDGIPYYPTLSIISESPLKQGALYVGTDDGNLQVSMDDGKSWENVTSKLPGIPESPWISGIEASKYVAGRAYVAVNNYRNNDFANYLYVTEDFGKTWQSIVGNLPADRVLRTIREDTKNENVLFLGTELGLFVSIDRGNNWAELKSNMPTMAFNDLVIHPRDNDLVLGTHNRGVWILDNISSIQELKPSAKAQLFSVANAQMINYSREGGHTGDMIFRGENPSRGAVIDYYLGSAVGKNDVALSIEDKQGNLLKKLRADTTAGVNRVVWNFTGKDLPQRPSNPFAENSGGRNWWRRTGGIPVAPGDYVVKLKVNGEEFTQDLKVENDPRVEATKSQLDAWASNMESTVSLYGKVISEAKPLMMVHWNIEKLKSDGKKLDNKTVEQVAELYRMYDELLSRSMSLYGQVAQWQGEMTGDQQSQYEYYVEMVEKLKTDKQKALAAVASKINKRLKKSERIDLGKK